MLRFAKLLGRSVDDIQAKAAELGVVSLGLPGYLRIVDLKHRLRCENCGERGTVELTIIWADR